MPFVSLTHSLFLQPEGVSFSWLCPYPGTDLLEAPLPGLRGLLFPSDVVISYYFSHCQHPEQRGQGYLYAIYRCISIN